jgi:hypothetical protein
MRLTIRSFVSNSGESKIGRGFSKPIAQWLAIMVQAKNYIKYPNVISYQNDKSDSQSVHSLISRSNSEYIKTSTLMHSTLSATTIDGSISQHQQRTDKNFINGTFIWQGV